MLTVAAGQRRRPHASRILQARVALHHTEVAQILSKPVHSVKLVKHMRHNAHRTLASVEKCHSQRRLDLPDPARECGLRNFVLLARTLERVHLATASISSIHSSHIGAAYQPIGPRGSGTNRMRENSQWLATAKALAIATARRCDDKGNCRKLFSSRITPWPTTNHIA